MQRREYLSIAAGGTALLTGGVGSAAAKDWLTPGDGDGGDGSAVQSTDFESGDSDGYSSEPGVEVDCNRTTVEVDGTIEVRNSCYTASLQSARFVGDTLRLVVEETQLPDQQVCLQVVTPIDYVATVETTTPPESVTVVHRGVSESTFERQCDSTDGTTSDTGDGDSGTGDGSDTGIGWW